MKEREREAGRRESKRSKRRKDTVLRHYETTRAIVFLRTTNRWSLKNPRTAEPVRTSWSRRHHLPCHEPVQAQRRQRTSYRGHSLRQERVPREQGAQKALRHVEHSVVCPREHPDRHLSQHLRAECPKSSAPAQPSDVE